MPTRRNQCIACIEDFGVPHEMTPWPVVDDRPVYLCDFHDHPGMETIRDLDPLDLLGRDAA